MKSSIISLLFVIYCILMPFEEAIAFGFGSILKIVGIAIILFSLTFYKLNSIHKDVKPLFLWFLLMLLSFLWVTSQHYWTAFITIYVGQIALIYAMEMVYINDIKFKWIDVGLVLTGCVAAYVLIRFPATSMFTEEGRRTIMINDTALDPNIVAATIILGLHIATNFFLEETKLIKRCLWGFPALFMLYGILLTGSRGALIAFVLSFLLKIILEGKGSFQARKKSIMLILLGIVGFFVMVTLLPQDLIESRFSKDTILGLNERERGSHNRYDIWEASWNLFVRNPILGVGCGNFINSIRLVYFRECAAHNLYVLCLIEGGIVGFALLISFMKKLISKLYKHGDFLTLSIFMATLFMSLSLDALPYKFFWITIIYARLQLRRSQIQLSCN